MKKIILFLIFSIFQLPSYAQTNAVIYSYDNINRLTQIDYGSGKVIQFTYDKVGNRTTHVITDPGANQPVLSVNPTSLNFGTTTTQMTFNISNTGGGTLNWQVTENEQWITSATPASGQNNGTVTVTIDRTGLTPNTYNGIVSVTSDGGNQNVQITMTVNAGGIPAIRTPVDDIVFGSVAVGAIEQGSTTVYNDGTGTLTLTGLQAVISDPDYTVMSTFPINIAPGGSAPITISFSPTSAGTRTATYKILHNDANQPNVQFNVAGQGFIQPGSFPLTVQAENMGGVGQLVTDGMRLTGPNNWYLLETVNLPQGGWIKINVTASSEGQVGGQWPRLEVVLGSNFGWQEINTTQTGQYIYTRQVSQGGTYTFQLQLDQVTRGNPNFAVFIDSSVISYYQPQPVLSVTPTTLNFGNTSTQQTFAISNTGDGNLTWNTSESSPWITSVLPASGVDDATVTVTIDRAGQPVGNHQDFISVTSDGGNETVTVNMTVDVAIPQITSFTPTSGPVATVVTINGSNFTTATAVAFNGVSDPNFTINSDTQITAAVPVGATSGKITVTAPGGVATSSGDFIVSTVGGIVVFQDDFDRTSLGPDWSLSVANGSVTIEEYPPDGRMKMYNPNASGTNTRAFIVAQGTTNLVDATVTFDFDNGPEQRQNNSTAIYLRYVDANNYYNVRVGEDNYNGGERYSVAVAKTVNGIGTIMQENQGLLLAPGRYEFSVIGDQISFYDISGGTTVFIGVTDNELTQGGQVGFNVNEETTFFDDVTVTSFDAQQPSISINDVTITEGNSGVANAVFSVALSNTYSQQITVDYASADGTATAGNDYVAIPTTQLVFPPNTTTQTITVAVNGDLLDENDETFFVNLSNATNATIADNQGLGTITDDDAPPALSTSDVSVPEGNTGTVNAVFTVSLSAASGKQVTVDYATADSTATAGSDYVAGSGTVTFAAGTTTQTIAVVINGDVLDEQDEIFSVNLSNPINATISDNQGLGTITDDDGLPSISINDVTVIEGNMGTVNAVFTVSLSSASGQQVTVDYATADSTATAGSDYVAIPTTQLVFPPNTISQTITVAVNGDSLDENDETFFVNLNNAANATIADNQGQGTITNDDVPPVITINNVTVAEGDTGTVNAVFTLSLSLASGKQVTIDYSTADSTATAGSDYVAIPTTQLIFPPDSATQTITVVVNGDFIDEPDEIFLVKLSNPTNATIADTTGLGTITDDDAAPAIAITDTMVTEGNTGTVNVGFRVTLSAASSQQITVDYATADSTATAGSDYVAIPTTQLVFPPNTTIQTITVTVNGDLFDEQDEYFLVNLSNPANATIADAKGIGTIVDDDQPSQTLTFNPSDDGYVRSDQVNSSFGTAAEFGLRQNSPTVNSYLKFTVSGIISTVQSAKLRFVATGTTNDGGSVYSVSNDYQGTATPWDETGLTYNNAPAISGPPWSSVGSVAVGDTVDFDVTSAISGDSTYSFGLTNASLQIARYSSLQGANMPEMIIRTGVTFPSLSIDNVTVTEGNSGTVNATFTVSLSATSSQIVTVNYTTADGTAKADSDYVPVSGVVSFPAGTTTQPVTVQVIGDVITEPNETFFVNLSNPTNATIADGQGQGTITDDDMVTLTFNPSDDAYVRSDQANSNFGTAPEFGMRQNSPTVNSYLKFVVSGLTGTVQSATLRFVATGSSNDGGAVYSVSNDYQGTATPWDETGLTYNNAPTISGTPWSTVGSVTTGQTVDFDVTGAITSNGTFSFGLNNASPQVARYSAKEGGNIPELIVQAGTGVAVKLAKVDLKQIEQENTVFPEPQIPEQLILSPNYPNPFNAKTVIEYALPEAAKVQLVIFNILGQQVRMLIDDTQTAGYKRVVWNGRDKDGREVGTGIYLYQLEVGRERLVRKMILQQ